MRSLNTANALSPLERVRTSPYIQEAIWAPYAKVNPYAAGITIDDAIDACIAIGERTLS